MAGWMTRWKVTRMAPADMWESTRRKGVSIYRTGTGLWRVLLPDGENLKAGRRAAWWRRTEAAAFEADRWIDEHPELAEVRS